MRRILFAAAIFNIVALLYPAPKASADSKSDGTSKFLVGMVPDTGGVNDRSFNQGTWEGIKQAAKDFNLDCKYLDPASDEKSDYMDKIEELINEGAAMIICAGFTFESAMFDAQYLWPNVKFVLLDGAPHNDDYTVFDTAQNCVGLTWMEHESGFVAGIAAAVHIFDGKVGFIGGMEIPAVQRYNWGFQRGIAYANWQYGTLVTVEKEDVVYQGSFTDIAAGKQLAKEMYDRGVRCIFAAAGAVGLGVIDEAKSRRSKLTAEELQKSLDLSAAASSRDKSRAMLDNLCAYFGIERKKQTNGKETTRVSPYDVWMVGVDTDQYEAGMMENAHSVVLTSAQKDVSLAAYTMIKDAASGRFKGGQNIEFSARTGGVGIPKVNPNLSKDADMKSQLALKHMSYNVVRVRGDGEGLIE